VTGAPLFGSEPAPERLFTPEYSAEEAP